MRWVKRILAILVIVLLVAVLALMLLPGERIASIAADRISAATGRQVTIEGETTITFYPILGVSTGGVEVANAGWSEAGPMVAADSLKVGVEPLALIGGDIRITGIEAVNPRIRLERAEDGRANWQLGAPGAADADAGGTADDDATSAPPRLTLDKLLITGAALSYTDHQTGTAQALRDLTLDLRWPDYAGAARFDARLSRGGGEVTVVGTLEQAGAFLEGEVTALDLTVSAPGGTASFDGQAAMQPQLDGRLTADLGDTARFLAALGVPGADLPQGLGRSIDAATQVTLTEGPRLSLRDLSLGLESNRLKGGADLFLDGDTPRFSAQLAAGALDLSALFESGAGGDAASPPDAGWSKAPIDASGLALADGEVTLDADSIDLGGLQFGRTRTKVTLQNSRAVFTLRELAAYEGSVTGEIVVNNRSGLSVGGDMTARGLNMETFLADAAGLTRFAAAGDADLRFLGTGASLYAIMNSLSGEGQLSTGRGKIRGIDLDKLMRSGDVSGGTTIFKQMNASFTIEDGNLLNRDLVMDLPLARAEGAGRIGLGARDIDYTLTPVLLEGESGRGLAIPVRIRGPWSGPRILPDLEKALQVNFDKQTGKLKEGARQKLDDAVQDQLGITPGDGQSGGDTLKQKIEDGAKKGLKSLFE